MERLTNRDKEIPLPNADNALFWARVYEKLARYEDAKVLTFEYMHKCAPCKPTQPECGECEFAKPQTNADRIRSMTDEELAEWLKKQTCLAHNYGYECADGEPDFPDGLPANYDYLTWLKKEVEDGEQS